MAENQKLPAYQELERKQPLAEYGICYFNELLSEYRTLSTTNADPEAKARAEEILKKESLTWGDIYTFETTILKLQPLATVRRRAWVLREKYHTLVGDQAYDVYLKSNPPDPENGAEAELRADLDQLLDNFHWQYTVTMAGERMRGRLSKWIVGVMGVVVICFAIAALVTTCLDLKLTIPTIAIVLFMGMLGGFVSTELRLQSGSTQGEPIENLARLDHGWLSVLISPVSGAIFAVVLYMLFIGNFLNGNLFPQIATPKDGVPTGLAFHEFANFTGPGTGAEYAKLIVWSFIAGFAERFVPDALTRVVAANPADQK